MKDAADEEMSGMGGGEGVGKRNVGREKSGDVRFIMDNVIV